MPAAAPLLRRTTCPHCWSAFAPEDALWVSAHAELLGDPLLGPEQPQRFLPTRFNVEGNALDAKGLVCHALACPHCHLGVPRALVEAEPFFVSILGTPACGKSYYLAALTWQLRQLLPKHFGLHFADADPASNRILGEYEEALFLNPSPGELVPLADLIRKTELQGELYDTVTFGGHTASFPRPFLFALNPQDNHPRYESCRHQARVLCLYDNAGEHFQPGHDSAASPVTRHLAHSRLLLFVFDPTQDQRFRESLSSAAAAPVAGRPTRQEAVLQEAATRVRRYAGLAQGQKHDRPLVIVVTKRDVWDHLLKDQDTAEPWARSDWLFGIDLDRVEARSRAVRELLAWMCPEFVAAAEAFAQTVVYVPVSALGQAPEPHARTGGPAIRPRDIRPVWVTAPLLYGMARALPGLVTGLKRRAGPAARAGDARSGRPAERRSEP